MTQIDVRDCAGVMAVSGVDAMVLQRLLTKYHLRVEFVVSGDAIPGSYWGESEAGLIGNVVYVRDDTPLHSVLHEACHYVCMDGVRRSALDTNAGGDYDEENGVCYLQILLADEIDGFGRERMMQDMDAWGYTFRLGSAVAWFSSDADDAKEWLVREKVIDAAGLPTWRLRD